MQSTGASSSTAEYTGDAAAVNKTIMRATVRATAGTKTFPEVVEKPQKQLLPCGLHL